MKRSEMIDLIERHLDCVRSEEFHGCFNEQAAEDLLDALEKAGMRPPPRAMNYTWEPEDD